MAKGKIIRPVNMVGALGPQNSYSDHVARQVGKKVLLYSTFRKVLGALDRGETPYALIPFENNTTGGVEGLKVLLKRQTAIQIVGEYRLPIIHSLIIGKHITTISEITTVYSHPQALAQCSKIIEQYGWETKTSLSTSAAVDDVLHLPFTGAIAHANVATTKGANVLAEGIQDEEGNLTRFLLIKKISHCEAPIQNWDRAYFFMSVIEGADHSRTAIQNAIGTFSEYGVRIRYFASIPAGRKYISFFEIYKSHGYDALLKMLSAQKNLRVHELGRGTLNELDPPPPLPQ